MFSTGCQRPCAPEQKEIDMLAMTLSLLLATAAIGATAVLADSFVRGWNRYRDLTGSAHDIAPSNHVRIVRMDAGSISPLPGLRQGPGRRSAAVRPSAIRSLPARAAA